MKKSKKIGLSLNKKVVSSLQSNQLKGGTRSFTCSVYTIWGCPGGGGGTYTCGDGSECKCK